MSAPEPWRWCRDCAQLTGGCPLHAVRVYVYPVTIVQPCVEVQNDYRIILEPPR